MARRENTFDEDFANHPFAIDLTDETNANWRDRLRANPDDPAFSGPKQAFDISEVLGKPGLYAVKKAKPE